MLTRELAAVITTVLGNVCAQGLDSTAHCPERTGQPRIDVPTPTGMLIVPNRGQWEPKYRFACAFSRVPAACTIDGFRFHLPANGDGQRGSNIAFRFEGMDLDARLEPSDRAATRFSFLSGTVTRCESVPSYRELRYRGAYDGIDVVVHDRGGEFEYDFDVEPGSDMKQVVVRVTGGSLLVDDAGDLVVTAECGERIVQPKPVAWYITDDGKELVECRFRIVDGDAFGFEIDDRNSQRRLIIDPKVIWSRFADSISPMNADQAWAVDADSSGKIYVTGETLGGSFLGLAANPAVGLFNAFFVRFSADGLTPETVVSIGGDSHDRAFALACDGSGGAWIVGQTQSPLTGAGAFPIVGGLPTTGQGGPSDAFVAHVDSSGSLVYSTRLGGTSIDLAFSIDLVTGSSNEVWVGGRTQSTDYPIVGAVTSTTLRGPADGFITRLSTTSGIVASAFVGGATADTGEGVSTLIAGASADEVIAGSTVNVQVGGGVADPPVTSAGTLPASSGRDFYLCRWSSNLTARADATYMGTTGSDSLQELVQSAANPDEFYAVGDAAAVSGSETGLTRISVNPGGLNASQHVLVSRYDFSDSSMDRILIGSDRDDSGRGIVLGSDLTVYVCGFSGFTGAGPSTFPGVAGSTVSVPGDQGAVVLILDPALSHLRDSAVYGGSDPVESVEDRLTDLVWTDDRTIVCVGSSATIAYANGYPITIGTPPSIGSLPPFGRNDAVITEFDAAAPGAVRDQAPSPAGYQLLLEVGGQLETGGGITFWGSGAIPGTSVAVFMSRAGLAPPGLDLSTIIPGSGTLWIDIGPPLITASLTVTADAEGSFILALPASALLPFVAPATPGGSVFAQAVEIDIANALVATSNRITWQ